jgi:hypothetical protein
VPVQPLGADYVVKIAEVEKIRKEVKMHRLIDKSSCLHLQKALLDLSGTIQGAGLGLAGIALKGHFYRSISSTDCMVEIGTLGTIYFKQVRIKADDIIEACN